MHVDTAVERADIDEQRSFLADARYGLIGVLFIVDRLIRDSLTADKKRAYQQEKVRYHEVGEPVFLKIRQAVEHKEGAHRLFVDYPVHLNGEGLEAYSRIELVFMDVCSALA